MTSVKPLWLKTQVMTELYRHHVTLEQAIAHTVEVINRDIHNELTATGRQKLYDLYHALRAQDWMHTAENAAVVEYMPSPSFLQLREMNASMTPSLAAMLGMHLFLGLDAPDKKVVDM